MRDDFTSQAWADNHQHISTAIHKLVRGIADVFDKLQASQYEAPWLARPRRKKAECGPTA